MTTRWRFRGRYGGKIEAEAARAADDLRDDFWSHDGLGLLGA